MTTSVLDETLLERNQWMVVADERKQLVDAQRQEIAALKRRKLSVCNHEPVLAKKDEIIDEQRLLIKGLRAEIAQKDSVIRADSGVREAALRVQVVEQQEIIDGLRKTIARLQVIGGVMSALECCKCRLPYNVAGNPRKSLCPYCGAYGGDEIAQDVAQQLILRPARLLHKPVRRRVVTPYRRLAQAGR